MSKSELLNLWFSHWTLSNALKSYFPKLPPDELERRRIRRERNKMAAAKCRNRRRELTETLQNVGEHGRNGHASGLRRPLTCLCPRRVGD